MLKVFLGFLVSVVVLLSSAYVTPTYATSANLLITRVQAGAIGAATQEFIVIYNNSPEEIDISGWCLTNKNNAPITCFTTPLAGQVRYLPAYAYATAVSSSLALSLPIGTATSTYIPLSQSSGSIAGSNDAISLIDTKGKTIDSVAWTTPLSAGMQLERHGISSTETLMGYQDTDGLADWSVTLSGMLPHDETYVDVALFDVCPNIDGIQASVPVGKEMNVKGECVDVSIAQLDITEILPNASGSDDGHEFIELYNPNDTAVNLADYTITVGLNGENSYDFPDGTSIQPRSYLSFSNSDIPFSLLNSSSRVFLSLRDGNVVSETPVYTNPKDNQSWAVIDGVWQYVEQPTPGAANVVDGGLTEEVVNTELVLQPCAANQYRSLETNRCRLISTNGDTVTPCKDGQYRSEETGRCRTIASDAKTVTPCEANEERNPDTGRCRKIVATTAPAACKEGQERNPDTNRCRTITKMPNADYGVLGTETKSSGNWYVFAAIAGLLLFAIVYAVWEWHDELGKLFKKVRSRVRQVVRIHK